MDPMLPQNLDAAACYRMLRSRDPRFDGRFFVGVSSTRIYCRPICTARTPRRENCAFFSTAAAAERHGFRPCLRCRPELAPGFASIDAPARLAQAAAAMVDEGALDGGDVAALAARLGVGDRHLRRIFDRHFGVSPLEYARTQRLLLAKRLLTDTRLPVTEVALASGFASLRRFNDCFARSYRLTPSELRRSAAPAGGAGAAARPAGGPVPGAAHGVGELRFRLAYRPPLDWTAMVDFLGHRAIEGVEAVDAEGPGDPAYRRLVRVPAAAGRRACASVGDRIGWVEVRRPPRRQAAPVLLVTVDPALVGAIPAVLARVRRAFDLACHPQEVAAALGELARGREGMRLPGAFDGFEMAVRAILGQQITVKAARTLAGRFVRAFGEPAATPWPALSHAFPGAASIARRDPADLAAVGITGQRARSIVALASALAGGGLRLEPDAEVPATVARLRQLPGIGEWTAQYVAMRALGWPDAYPAGDVGVMRALGTTTARATAEALERWRPWRAYAVIHLWSGLASAAETQTRR
jgi:AraC family transcriptional regulator, regulatory protein of adaptative response / DNA-3-methyladenine glycosylase II